MGKETSIKSLKAQNLVWRILKIAFYLAGFLLLFHLVQMEAGENLGGQFFSEAAKFATYYVLAAWAAVFVVQLLCAALLRKSAKARMIIVALVGFATVVFPVIKTDFFVKEDIEAMAPLYEEKGFDFDSYEIQLGEYGDLASDLNDIVSDFTEYYNIKYKSKVYGSKNTDWSAYAYTEDGITLESDDEVIAPEDFFLKDAYVFGLEKGDAYYSKNGMYADGYVFGFAQARHILETYYNYRKTHPTADTTLDAAIEELINNPFSDWNLYLLSDDYLDFYSDDLTDVANAKRYYVTRERLEAILSVLGANLGATNIGQTIGTILGVNLSADLTLSDLLDGLGSFGLTLSEKDVLELLEGFSYYQSPQTFPVFYFLEDEELRDYAYAKYYGETHGAKVGSVLIGERVGEVTMDENGNPAEEDIDERLESFQRYDLDKSYMPEAFKWIALRANCLVFVGIIPFSIIAAYFFAYLERKSLKKLIQGGAR